MPIIIVSGALEVHQQMEALAGTAPRSLLPHQAAWTFANSNAPSRPPSRNAANTEVVRQFEALERSHRVDALDLFSRSTDRLSRQNRIRELIGKSRERPNISALAREFNVARRTIIRDLQELIRRGQLKPEVYPEWENPPEED